MVLGLEWGQDLGEKFLNEGDLKGGINCRFQPVDHEKENFERK